MKTQKILFNFLLYFILTIVPAFVFGYIGYIIQQESQWEFVKEKDGIKVYLSKDVEEEANGVKGYKTLTSSSDINFEKAVMEIKDFSKFDKWYFRTAKTELVKTLNNGQIVLFHIDTPYPFKDRYSFLKTKVVSNTDKYYKVEINSQPNFDYKGNLDLSDKVQVVWSSGLWEIKKEKNGKTFVNHEYTADPGGFIPKWLVNLTLTDLGFYTANAFKEFTSKI